MSKARQIALSSVPFALRFTLRRWWTQLQAFLFAAETDKWLAALRIGLGLQVTVYALFLRSDWHYLFASVGK